MNEQNNTYELNVENKPEIYQMNSHFVHNGNWGKENKPHLEIWTGWPEGPNQLTDKDNLNLLFNRTDVAFGHFFLGGLTAFNKDQINQLNIQVMDSAKGLITGISYSAGIFTFRNVPESYANKFSSLTILNPFLGREVIWNKHFFVKLPNFPFPNSKTEMKELNPFLMEMSRQGKLSFIISERDEYLNPDISERIIKYNFSGMNVVRRDGGHTITPEEVIKLFGV